jgi:hypothetical protein
MAEELFEGGKGNMNRKDRKYENRNTMIEETSKNVKKVDKLNLSQSSSCVFV